MSRKQLNPGAKTSIRKLIKIEQLQNTLKTALLFFFFIKKTDTKIGPDLGRMIDIDEFPN